MDDTYFLLLFCLPCALLPSYCFSLESTPRIAVIGGGIGGCTAVHYLKGLFKDDCSITLFEKSRVGGRMATVKLAGKEYESGASVLHPRNMYLVNFTKLLGLHHKASPDGILGIYDGKDFLFKESSWELITLARLVWRYGWNVVKMKLWISDMLDKFVRIYDLQDKEMTFTTVDELMKALHPSFPEMMQVSLDTYMTKIGFSQNFIDELAQAVMLVNYGQTKNISAFVGAVSFAGAQPLWSVKGGNKLVAEGLLKRAGVSPQHAEVVEIALQSEKTFSITYKISNPVENLVTKVYDIVIVATPLVHRLSEIQFENFPSQFPKFDGEYHRTVATFVKGKLRQSFFGLHSESLDEILTNNPSLPFSSLGKLSPVDYVKNQKIPEVWKIFSQKFLSLKEKYNIFESIEEEKVVDWLAYPQYPPPKVMPSFILHPGLFYTSDLEWAASAIEMGAIAGRNVALLAHKFWTGDSSDMDILPTKEKIKKVEL